VAERAIGLRTIGMRTMDMTVPEARWCGVSTEKRLGCEAMQLADPLVATTPVQLTPELVDLLAPLGLLKPFLRQSLLADLARHVDVADEERQQVLDGFMREHKIDGEAALAAFLTQNLLRLPELEDQLLQPLRLSRYINHHHLPKAEARFLARKQQLDRVVYSLLRLEDAGLARELYLQIQEGEADFAELAARYAEGPERTTRGIVGPVPLMQAHPLLAERLRTASPGVLLEPFRVERWWLVMRLEAYAPASLDEATAQQMARELFDEAVDEQVSRQLQHLIPLRFQP
jgi:parvulin-like peptidyl-prolyl isomerase